MAVSENTIIKLILRYVSNSKNDGTSAFKTSQRAALTSNRKTNYENDSDLLKGPKELGYDLKNPEFIVDSKAIGALIAHLGKKKQQQKDSTEKSSSLPKTKNTKPRVLNRNRKEAQASAEIQIDEAPPETI